MTTIEQPDVTAVADRGLLTESPRWIASSGSLVWVDILEGYVHGLVLSSGERWRIALDPPLGFVLPREDGGFVVGQGLRVLLVERDGAWRELADLAPWGLGDRLNDGRCDATGRLWTGTMSNTREPEVAGLFTVEPDGGVACVLDGVTLSNGLDWGADGKALYYVDSTTHRVDRFCVDLAVGRLGERTTVFEVPPEDGLPDGLAVDVDGGVWVALFGGGALRRYLPDGRLERTVRLPVSCPTSLTFAGALLDWAYVTTARHKLDEQQQAREPLAGCVLRVALGMRGREEHRFRRSTGVH